jgi:hypothetical protein
MVLDHTDTGLFGYGDEIYPVGAHYWGGAYYVYYTFGGAAAATNRQLGVAWGTSPTALTSDAQVLASAAAVPCWGAVSVVDLDSDTWGVFVTSFEGAPQGVGDTHSTKAHVDAYTCVAGQPWTLTGPVAIYEGHSTIEDATGRGSILLDRKASTWYYYFRDGDGGPRYRVATAPAVPALSVPADPTGVTVVSRDSTSVLVSWTDVATDEEGYQIEISSTGASRGYTVAGATGPGATQYISSNLNGGSKYWFRVRAFNSDGWSDFAKGEGAPRIPLREPSAGMVAGRIPLPQLLHAGFQGQDLVGGAMDTNSVTYSDSLRVRIATTGRGYYHYSRVFTNTAQFEIGQIKEINPNYEFFTYVHYGHVPTYEPGDGVRPLETARKDLLWSRRVYDTGDSVVAAYRDGNGDVTAYWANYGLGEGDTYRIDKELVDADIDLYVDAWNNAEHKPIGVIIDYFNGTNLNSGGYYEFDTDRFIDLDNDGITFASDANERAVYDEFQQYWLESFRERFDENLIVIANGRGSITNVNAGEIGNEVARLDGVWIEGFPHDCPFLSNAYDDPDDQYDLALDQFNDSDYRVYDAGRSGPIWWTDLRPNLRLNTVQAKFARAGALMFDGVWSWRPYETNIIETELLDEVWIDWTNTLGDPTGSPSMAINGDNKVYTRSFQGGDLEVTLNSTAAGISQFVSVKVDGVTQ